MGNGLRLRITRNDGHKPKTRKKSDYEKQKKYPDLHRRRSRHPRDLGEFIAGRAAAPAPQNYTGKLTHGEFVSCEGQILNPPAYSVGGTWVLNIDMMTQPQVPPPAHLTMVVFRDGSHYLVFPHIELTPVSLQDGIYTYTWGTQVDGDARYEYDSRDVRVARRIRRQLHPAQLRVADLLRSSQQLGPDPDGLRIAPGVV